MESSGSSSTASGFRPNFKREVCTKFAVKFLRVSSAKRSPLYRNTGVFGVRINVLRPSGKNVHGKQ